MYSHKYYSIITRLVLIEMRTESNKGREHKTDYVNIQNMILKFPIYILIYLVLCW